MTLNSVVKRIKEIVISHGQIKSFGSGFITDFLTEKTTKYAASFLQSTGGSISTSGRATTLNFTLFFLDLAHVSSDAKENELSAQSDMLSVAMDIITKMKQYTDWAIGDSNTIRLIAEGESDIVAGCSVDISIRIMYKQNICEIP